jgi:BirA family biotin operon repressor/biotin-[acetyl-CoA-carboxylase] ligase
MKIGSKIIHLESVDSTNNYAANLIQRGNCVHGTVIMADNQFSGRGQRGANWLSMVGDNLTFSTVVYPDKLAVEQQFYITCFASMCILSLLNDFGIKAEIKWPNDIYVNNHKIAGILVENYLQGQSIKTSIIGIGLNVNSYPEGIKAICIRELLLKKMKPFDVLLKSLDHMNNWFDLLNDGNFSTLLEKYNEMLYMKNRFVDFEDESGRFQGKVIGAKENGLLEISVGNENRFYGIKQVIWSSESRI